jgi:hypothetical protein
VSRGLDDLLRLVQLTGQPQVVLFQPGDFAIPGVCGLATGRTGRGFNGTPVTLLAPFGEE